MGRCVTGSSKKLTLLARGSLNPMDVVHLHGHVRADLLRDSDRELIRRRRLVVVRDDDDVAGQVLTFDVLERDAFNGLVYDGFNTVWLANWNSSDRRSLLEMFSSTLSKLRP
jgi:hypothetical protein